MDLEPLKNKDDGSLPRVLIVDDSDVIRRSMTYVLRSEFNVTSVESGNQRGLSRGAKSRALARHNRQIPGRGDDAWP